MNHRLGALLVILLLASSGCKKDAPKAVVPPPVVSPMANPPSAADDDPSATDKRPTPVDDKNDWRRDPKPGSGSAAAAKTEPAPPASQPADPPPETPAEKKARLAKIATSRAVDAALSAASGGLKRCYDQAKAGTGMATVSFQVRGTGYVMSPTVRGVNSTVAACLEGVLRQIRVSGVQTDGLAVQRTLRFVRR